MQLFINGNGWYTSLQNITEKLHEKLNEDGFKVTMMKEKGIFEMMAK